eukprot:Gb_00643 [translate_table: standard]
MYSEAKLAFIVYLWYPKTKGTTYVYETFVRPYAAKHETDIDRNLHELKTRAGDMALLYGKKSTVYVQTRFFELFQPSGAACFNSIGSAAFDPSLESNTIGLISEVDLMWWVELAKCWCEIGYPGVIPRIHNIKSNIQRGRFQLHSVKLLC